MRGVRGSRVDASQVRLVAELANARAGVLPVVFRDAPRNDGFGRTERTTKVVARDDLVARLSFSTSLRRPPRDTAFAAGLLPAGRYRLRVSTANAAAGRLDVTLGRDGAALTSLAWSQPEGRATATAEFDLVVPVRLVTVRGETDAVQAVTGVAMQPLQVRHRDERLGLEDVQRLATNGAYIVYLLSDALYVERDGMWIRPFVDVPMLVARDGAAASGPLRVFLRNGPFENQVTLTGAVAQSITLAANEERVVPLDVTWIDGAARLVVRASRGFRPFEVDAAATDPRLLGVWLAFP